MNLVVHTVGMYGDTYMHKKLIASSLSYSIQSVYSSVNSPIKTNKTHCGG